MDAEQVFHVDGASGVSNRQAAHEAVAAPTCTEENNMKILVATKQTQGQRASDFSFTQEGEIVMLDDDHDGEAVDGDCGCQRSMVGMNSGKSTTTFQVIEADFTRGDFINMIQRARADIAELGVSADNITAEANYLLDLAARFNAGSIVERRCDVFQARLQAA